MPAAVPESALLTGATGFIGSHLAARLKHHKCDTHAIIRSDSNAAALRQFLGDDHVHLHDGTIAGMLAIVERAQPRIIFHMASHFLAQHRSEDVSQLIRSNIEFAAQLAEAAAVKRIPGFINTGTVWQHFNDETFNPVNLYAATKQAFADILLFYTESNAFHALTLELFDTYGPADARPKLFSALRQAAQSGEPLAMSSGAQFLDLVYIDDVIDAYLAAAARLGSGAGQPSETFSVSSGHPRRLREVVELWSQIMQRPLNVNWSARPHRPREVMVPWSRGTALPGWQPRISLEDGIRKMESITRSAGEENG